MERILGYVDPGTGALLFQILIAGLLSVLMFFRNTVRRVTGFLLRPFSRNAVGPGGEIDPSRQATRKESKSAHQRPVSP